MADTQIPAVPLRTPMFAASEPGKPPVLDRTWQTFFVQLTGAIGGLGGATTSASGAASSSSSRYTVPITAGIAQPDASKATNVLTLTAADCLTDADGHKYVTVAGPINYSTGTDVDTRWTLIIRQDPDTPSGGYSSRLDTSAYFLKVTLATPQSAANTECHVDLRTNASGNTSLAGLPSVNQPIAP